MKKLLSILIILTGLFVASCQQIDLQENLLTPTQERHQTTVDRRYDVSLTTARYLAQVISKNQIKEIKPIVYGGRDTVMYVVNYSDGWVVISGDKRAVPILASSKTGSFKSEEQNPGSAIWFSETANEILSVKRSNPSIDTKSRAENQDYNFWMKIERAAQSQNKTKARASRSANANDGFPYLGKKLVSVSLASETETQTGPLIKTKWGQSTPWNTKTPKVWSASKNNYVLAPTGCTAVAMAQILYFTHYKFNTPSGLYHTISNTGLINKDGISNVIFTRKDYVENSPRWDQMPLYSFLSNTDYVADLMADVGNRLGMKYTATASGAFLTQSAMQAYGLTYDEKKYSASDVISQIRRGMPVLITAYTGSSSTDIGHQWIIDGLSDNLKIMQYDYIWELFYVPRDSGDPHYIYTDYEDIMMLEDAELMEIYPGITYSETTGYLTTSLLMNWGWNGYNDSQLYSASTFPWTAAGYNFQSGMRIQYNIRKK